MNRLSVQDHLTGFSLVYAHNHFYKGGLSGTVFTHQGMDFTGFQVKVYLIQSFDTGENFGNAVKLQDSLGHYTRSFHRLA